MARAKCISRFHSPPSFVSRTTAASLSSEVEHVRLPCVAFGLLLHTANPTLAQSPNALVGTWQLISRIDRDSAGRVLSETSLGSAPLGYLIYDAAGHVAAQLAARDRPPTVCDTTRRSAEANNNANIGGYSAYFGRYQVDPDAGVVTHDLDGAIAPGDAGRTLTRKLQGRGRLTGAVSGALEPGVTQAKVGRGSQSVAASMRVPFQYRDPTIGAIRGAGPRV